MSLKEIENCKIDISNTDDGEETNVILKLLREENKKLLDKNEYLTKENSKLKLENGLVKMKNTKNKTILHTENEIILEKYYAALEENKVKEEKIKELQKNIDENKEIVLKYESLLTKYKECLRQNNSLTTEVNEIKELNTLLRKEIQDKCVVIEKINVECDGFRNERGIMKNDIFYLTEKKKETEEKLKTNAQTISSLKEKNDSLNKQVDESKRKFDQELRCHLELQKINLEAKHSRDIAELEKTLKLQNETKMKFYIERDTDQKNDIRDLNIKCSSNVDLKDTITLETKNQINSLNDEIQSLKISLKLKDTDIVRCEKQISANNELIQLIKKENSSLKSKLDLMKKELELTIKTNAEENSKIKAKLAYVSEENKSYQQVESELDKILCESFIKSTNDPKTLDLIATMENLPLNNRKRLNQCYILAHRLKEMNSEQVKLKTDYDTLKNDYEKVKGEKEVYISMVNKMKSPYEYLLVQLQEKENIIDKLNESLRNNELKLQYAMDSNRRLEQSNEDVTRDLKTVLANRQKIDNLEYLIASQISQSANLPVKKKFGPQKTFLNKYN